MRDEIILDAKFVAVAHAVNSISRTWPELISDIIKMKEMHKENNEKLKKDLGNAVRIAWKFEHKKDGCDESSVCGYCSDGYVKCEESPCKDRQFLSNFRDENGGSL